MNRKNIAKVRDHIAGLPPERFDMSLYVSGADEETFGQPIATRLEACGTAACIAGWTAALLAPDTFTSSAWSVAQHKLGLEYTVSEKLFTPVGFMDARFTRAHAVRVLDHLLATGEVDWKSTRRAKKATAQ